MFIETLEFTIPVDLCDLVSTLKEGPRPNLEFPASVNSYGTTQDANVQVALRANKLTFTVDGVSSNASMISKSECKTLKLSVFDVDHSLIAQECETSQVQSTPISSKRTHEYSTHSTIHSKKSRTSYSDNYLGSPQHSKDHNNSHSSKNSRSKSPNNATSDVNVKEEPEDLDLIEIEPDAEPGDITKSEIPYMQVQYSSTGPSAVSERVSFPSSSSFQQSVPHVPDYEEPGPSNRGNQTADDYLVYQEDLDYGDNDNSADYSNEDVSDITDMSDDDFPEEEMEQAPAAPPTTTTGPKRFKTLAEDKLKVMTDSRQSQATKKNTKWGVQILQDWAIETLGVEINMAEIPEETLSTNLRKFYAEIQPRNVSKREKIMPATHASEYHKNTLKNVRAAINRHLHDLGRSIDIVRDREFRNANDMLHGKLKSNLADGVSRPTKHKPVVLDEDLRKISTYLTAEDNPVTLRYRNWYNLAIHFVTKGIEFHHQLKIQSIVFETDGNGTEYVSISNELKQNDVQGGLKSEEAIADKRMYSLPQQPRDCPVAALKLLISKTDPKAEYLFNNCNKTALTNPLIHNIWYIPVPVKTHAFKRYMTDITRNAGCSSRYTAHSLRATSIQAMNEAGHELRHIMIMSGHRNESSVRNYLRDYSASQKSGLSRTLSTVAVPNSSEVPSTERN